MSQVAHALPLAVYYEHPDWFRPLFAELDRRGIPWTPLDAASHRFDPDAPAPHALVFNRASPSAYVRGHPQSTFYTLHWLQHLGRLGTAVVNGAAAYALELSKASQIGLLRQLGIPHPRTVVINDTSQAVAAAKTLRFPVLIKANVGGSGAGIVRFERIDALADAAASGTLALGIDGTVLVQEAAPLRHQRITRIETLAGRLLYALHVYPAPGSFDLCPADACQTAGGTPLDRSACLTGAARAGLRVERATPSPELIHMAEAIARAASLDVGGIEFLIDDRDGRPYFFDINALSNFVADGDRVIGFDPHARLVDYLEARVCLAAEGRQRPRTPTAAGRVG